MAEVPGVNNSVAFLSRGGKMGELARSINWSETSLGPASAWPQSLQTAVSICLNSNFPICIYWGNQHVLIYNQAWSTIPGRKHPWAFGKTGKEVWPEIWNEIESWFETAFKGESVGSNDQLLFMERHGYAEECYFDFTFTPIYGESSKVEGVFNAVIETTETVLSARQMLTLRELSNLSSTAISANEVLIAAVEVLKKNSKDFPFAAVYRPDTGNRYAHLLGATDSTHRDAPFPVSIELNSPTPETAATCDAFSGGKVVLSLNYLDSKAMPLGGWDKHATHLIHIPVHWQGLSSPYAVIVAALNPFRQFDGKYKQFVKLAGDQVSTELKAILVIEEERQKAIALAEIDKAKTAFFTNISHEFRTPLTLMLGSLEELLNGNTEPGNSPVQQTLQIAHRNALRLLRLVNNLLDFSRIESGMVKATYQLTDLATFTSGLASNFRQLIESAGLNFNINMDSIIQPVYVDKEMWEKIVFNLLSNAFKYTLRGSISLSLWSEDNLVKFAVQDTGVGISEDELPKMFQRFHRVQNASGRTYEGTGIGLSLVSELVSLHKGNVTVESKESLGSKFIVTIPAGKAHLPETQLAEYETTINAALADTFIEEASSLLEAPAKPGNAEDAQFSKVDTVLIVDDNADMRAYITGILAKFYNVISARDGREALLKVFSHQPSLVVSDVMMPLMDGFELVKNIRSDSTTANIPVILLSARAGEESKIEGYETGADDYLTKPFSAKELLARIASNIKNAKSRQASEKNLRNIFTYAPVAICLLRGSNFIVEIANDRMLEIWGKTSLQMLHKPLFEGMPDARGQGFEELLSNVHRTGESFISKELPVSLLRNGEMQLIYLDFVYEPFFEPDGKVSGVIAVATEITDQVNARKRIEESELQYHNLIYSSPSAIGILKGPDLVITTGNDAIIAIWGKGKSVFGKPYFEALPELADQGYREVFHNVYTTGKVANFIETPVNIVQDGMLQLKYYNFILYPQRNINAEVDGIGIIASEVTPQAEQNKRIKESEERFQNLIREATVGVIVLTGEDMKVDIVNDAYAQLIEQKASELIGRRLFEVIPETEAYFRPIIDKVRISGDPYYLYGTAYYVWTNGKKKEGYLDVVYQPYRESNGKITGVTVLCQDVTEQVMARQKIEESANLFRTLAETLPQLVWMTDDQGEYLYASSQWYDYTGLDHSKKESWENVVHMDDVEALTKAWTDSLQTGVSYRAEARIKGKTGDYRWHFVKGEPVKNEEGKITKWIGAFTDIHDQKSLFQQLEQLVTERTRELARSNEDLQQFAHVASHDLKEPVRKIRTFTGRLQDEYAEFIPERGKTYLSKIASASERMYDMIDGVLLYSTVSTTERSFEKVDLNEIVSNIVSDLEIIIQQKEALIEFDQLPVIEGSAILLYQLFYNLIANSLKFTSTTKAPVIKVRNNTELYYGTAAANKDNIARISVCDNGIGFNQEFAKQIFQTFSRLNSKDKYEGTGLGLALCKKIAERHGGRIIATAVLHEGACFEVVLPTTQDHPKVSG